MEMYITLITSKANSLVSNIIVSAAYPLFKKCIIAVGIMLFEYMATIPSIIPIINANNDCDIFMCNTANNIADEIIANALPYFLEKLNTAFLT